MIRLSDSVSVSIFIKSLLNLLSESPFIQRMAVLNYLFGLPWVLGASARFPPVAVSVGCSCYRAQVPGHAGFSSCGPWKNACF